MQDNIKKMLKTYVEAYNKVQSTWEKPLVAYAHAQDPLFGELKKAVSPTHAMPNDFLEDAKTVITFFLPFTKSVVESNHKGKHASKDWAVAYIETNELIHALNIHIQEELEKLRYRSTIIPATHNFDEEELMSDWSHRHVAYIAGLGKFGLNNMLITKKGCCGRVGSIITNAAIEPTKPSKKEHCLYKKKGTCKKCVKRCVNASLTVESYNRHLCYEMCLENAKIHADLGLADVCGKCLVNVPCSYKNPVD